MAHSFYTSADSNRTAGLNQQAVKTVQAWKTPKTAQTNAGAIEQTKKPQEISAPQKQIIANLEKAAVGRVGTFDIELETAFSYADANAKIGDSTTSDSLKKEDSYQFEDVVDIINPLHHLPIVGMAYRGITGDSIHPASQIIGGGLFGGPIGAITGTVNAIMQMETGKDMGDHALSFAGLGPKPAQDSLDITAAEDNPEAQLNEAAENLSRNGSLDDLPASALSFVNLSEPARQYEQIKMAEGRTAGSAIIEQKLNGYRQVNIETNNLPLIDNPKINMKSLPPREAITSLSLASMPRREAI